MKKKNGFTLIELMIVIAMIGILSCIAYPGFKRTLNAQRLSAGIQSIHSALLFAKLSAVKESQIISVVFSLGQGTTGRYSVFIDNGTTGTNSGNGLIELADGEKILKTGSMPNGVNLYNIGLNGNLNAGKSTQFNRQGFPSRNAGGIPVFFDGAIYASVQIAPATPFYKKVSIGTAGNLIIEKSSDGINFFE